jgi:hypothetical protein
MRTLVLCTFLFAGSSAHADDPEPKRASDWTLEERLMLRFDPGHAAIRRAKAIAEGHTFTDPEAIVVLGSHNPELVLPSELMPHIAFAFDSNAEKRNRVRQKMMARGAENYLGSDFWAKLYIVARPFIEAYLENRRTTILLQEASEAEREGLRRRQSKANNSICPSSAEALRAAREAFGRANFDAFLYEVLADESVIIGSPMKSPEARRDLYRWYEGGCR